MSTAVQLQLVVALHLGLVLAVAPSAFLAVRRKGLLWLHVPLLLWLYGSPWAEWPCPLTTLENSLRIDLGLTPYAGSFMHYHVYGRFGFAWAGDVWQAANLALVTVAYAFALEDGGWRQVYDTPSRVVTKLRDWPVTTLGLCTLTACVFLFPSLGETLEYQRKAILAGEWWRLATAHLTHDSPRHLLWNLVPVAVAGAQCELRDRRRLLLCWGAAALLTAVAALGVPWLSGYRGMSSVATAFLGLLAAMFAREGRLEVRWAWAGGAIVILGDPAWWTNPLSAASHASGLLIGLAVGHTGARRSEHAQPDLTPENSSV